MIQPMLPTNPIRLLGPWNEGFALDFHTINSQYLGDDAYGHPQFDTTRTPIGELLYQLKYGSDKTAIKALGQAAAEFIEDQNWNLNLIVPVPPSRSGRRFQPVPLLAEEIARLLGWQSCPDCITKTKETDELKSIYEYQERLTQLRDVYAVATEKTMGKNVLVIDDLYRSGATLEAVVMALRELGKAQNVFTLTFTRTRSNR